MKLMKNFWPGLSIVAMTLPGVVDSGFLYGQQQPPTVGPVGVAPPIQPDARSGEIIRQRQALAADVSLVTDQMLLNPPPTEWLMWRRTYDVHGFSSLNQIDRNNVRELQTAWSWQVAPNTVEVTPLEHDGVLYVYGNGDHLQALDATNGELLWEYERPAPPGPAPRTVLRNIALYQDKVIFPTLDRHMLALNSRNGKVVWDHLMGDAKIGRMTSGPMIVKGKIIEGTAGCAAGGCPIIALDANDGRDR